MSLRSTNKQILFKSIEHSERSSGLRPVYLRDDDRSCWPVNRRLFCLCKPFFCKACPGNATLYNLSFISNWFEFKYFFFIKQYFFFLLIVFLLNLIVWIKSFKRSRMIFNYRYTVMMLLVLPSFTFTEKNTCIVIQIDRTRISICKTGLRRNYSDKRRATATTVAITYLPLVNHSTSGTLIYSSCFFCCYF